MLFAVPNTGEVERLADIFTEYNVSFRLGSRTRRRRELCRRDQLTSRAKCSPRTLVKAYVPDGVMFPEARLAIFGARDLFDESELWLRGRSARSRRCRRSFPISAICRSGTMSCTSNTASASTRG